MAFSFGFSGDDIEDDPSDVVDTGVSAGGGDGDGSGVDLIPARVEDLGELLSTLPSKISYSTIEITTSAGRTIRLPRRDLFDVRLQLMAEDDGTSSTPLSGLEYSDLAPNVYEGGYKTWECSVDLASYLFAQDTGGADGVDGKNEVHDINNIQHVIEMGCGSALPTLILFQSALRSSRACTFTLTDYNASVLRLVTLPNLLLSWLATLSPQESAPLFADHNGGVNPLLAREGEDGYENGDVYLTPALLSTFITTTHISLTLLSGSWLPVPTLLSLVPSSPDTNTLILGSETIYSPASLTAFTDAIVALLGRVERGRALVAAKKVYFGVGGSVDGFRGACGERGAVVRDLDGGGGEGVRRWVGEVRMEV